MPRPSPASDPLPISQPDEHWTRIKAIFVEALELPESERRGYVARACGGDDSLRSEIESLLASEKAAADFIETPAARLIGQDTPAPPQLEPGARLGAYEVTAFLAAGGMGDVYRARHTVLGREVAIKTVRAGAAEPAAQKRLVREAQNASILSHPNICTIFVVVDETGKAIVLDFGLAKRILPIETNASRDSTVTAHGALAGTLSHMAPEVLLGGQADARSDVWALGVLLYELVTGELPFTGRTPFETSSAILGDSPRRVGGRVPFALRLLIDRCLAKAPASRYQRAADVRDALASIARRNSWPLVGRLLISMRWKRWTSWTAVAVAVGGVAVTAFEFRARLTGQPIGRISTLAFVPMTWTDTDATSEYYARGITEALIGRLGAIADARVLAPASAARAAETATSRAELARQLRADAIVEGRVRRSPTRI